MINLPDEKNLQKYNYVVVLSKSDKAVSLTGTVLKAFLADGELVIETANNYGVFNANLVYSVHFQMT